jgi:hypothetical protein
MTNHPVPIRSTWRDPVGKRLTNGIIRRWQRLGWYGEVAATAAGIIHHCCECNSRKHVVFYKNRFLPTPGFYCPPCYAIHRAKRDAEVELNQKWREQLLSEYV